MLGYILKRVISGLVTIFLLITATFFLMRAIPGSPFTKGEQTVPQEIMDRLNAKYGMDAPLFTQYIRYLGSIVRGDFGESFKKVNSTVNGMIARGFPVSARVGAVAVVISLMVGLALGISSAIRHGGLIDGFAMVFATIGISVPTFVTSVLLLYLLAGGIFKVLPTYGLTSWRHYILPVTCLCFGPVAYIARLTRSSMLEVMRQDYIRTARAKGVKEKAVVLTHALRNAILPVVTYVGPLIAGLLTGSFIIERLYAIPGIGKYFVDSISGRDYNVILGITVFFGIFVVICNMLVDIFYGIIDPRVKINE